MRLGIGKPASHAYPAIVLGRGFSHSSDENRSESLPTWLVVVVLGRGFREQNKLYIFFRKKVNFICSLHFDTVYPFI